MLEMNRREFVVAATAACACACLCAENAQAEAPSGATVDIGKPADFPKGQISNKFLTSQKLLVVHQEDRIFVMNARCTHRGTTVKVVDGKIKCPAHGSTFTEVGTPDGGPAKAALFRYGVKLNESGSLIVDKSKQFGEKQWDDEGAFHKVS